MVNYNIINRDNLQESSNYSTSLTDFGVYYGEKESIIFNKKERKFYLLLLPSFWEPKEFFNLIPSLNINEFTYKEKELTPIIEKIILKEYRGSLDDHDVFYKMQSPLFELRFLLGAKICSKCGNADSPKYAFYSSPILCEHNLHKTIHYNYGIDALKDDLRNKDLIIDYRDFKTYSKMPKIYLLDYFNLVKRSF